MSAVSERLMNEKEVSEAYGLSLATLRAWRFRGVGVVYYKIGRSVRYRASDIEAWLKESVRSSTSDPGSGEGNGERNSELPERRHGRKG